MSIRIWCNLLILLGVMLHLSNYNLLLITLECSGIIIVVLFLTFLFLPFFVCRDARICKMKCSLAMFSYNCMQWKAINVDIYVVILVYMMSLLCA